MSKGKFLKYFPSLALGVLLGLLLGTMVLSVVYSFKGGQELLQQDLVSYYLADPTRRAEILTLLFVFILLGMALFGIKILGDEIQAKIQENQKLEEISRAKTEFVSFTAHQFRTPLSALKLTLRMFQEEDLGKLNKEQQEFAKVSSEAVESLLARVDNFLDISKIELEQVAIAKTRFSLEKFSISVKELLQKYIPLAQKKNILLEAFIPKEKEILQVILEVDWNKITQVLENLLENALNYTPSDGKIFLKIRPGPNLLTVSISDTGIGIPFKEQEKIFTKFFRASNVKKIMSKGTGLGLYLAKFFIERHGGKIWFRSEEGRGTTFYFTLPYYQPKVAAGKALEKL